MVGAPWPMFPWSYYDRYHFGACPPHEDHLHAHCQDAMRQLGWRTVAHEWAAKTAAGKQGVGDLVFQRGSLYMVVECKRKQKNKVFDQAWFYGQAWRDAHPDAAFVLVCVWTCKTQHMIGSL